MGCTSTRPGGYGSAIHGGRAIHFVYLLLRDHLPAGAIEKLICELEEAPETVAFSDDFLAARAIELNARIHSIDVEQAHRMAHDAIEHARGVTP